jgi:16S rRNA G966 N2-methylase RsmD
VGHLQPPLPQPAYDVIFLDPPYDTDPGPLAGAIGRFLAPGGVLVIEHATRRHIPDTVDGLVRVRSVRSGDSTLSFFAADAPASDAGGRDDTEH